MRWSKWRKTVFLFLFQLFKFKAYFLALFLMGKKSSRPTGIRAWLGGCCFLLALSHHKVSCGKCWNIVVCWSSCPWVKWSKLSREAPTNVFVRPQHSDLGFLWNCTSSLSRGNLDKSRKRCVLLRIYGQKRQYIFLWCQTTYCFKANQEYIMKFDAQEIKESTSLMNPKFLAAEASSPQDRHRRVEHELCFRGH